jgi:hypothetical protein
VSRTYRNRHSVPAGFEVRDGNRLVRKGMSWKDYKQNRRNRYETQRPYVEADAEESHAGSVASFRYRHAPRWCRKMFTRQWRARLKNALRQDWDYWVARRGAAWHYW